MTNTIDGFVFDNPPKEEQIIELAHYHRKLLDEAIDNTESYPTDKLQRWLGFIQGVLSVTGVIDVDEERDYTRPILHSYHKNKPKSF